MKRVSRARKSFTLSEYAKSIRLQLVDALSHLPRDIRDPLGAAAGFERIAAGSIALYSSRQYTVQNRRDSEHVENEIDLPLRDAVAAGPRAVRSDVLVFARNPEHLQIEP